MSNHSGSIDKEMHSAVMESLMKEHLNENIGPTGKFPEEKLTKKDDGELAFAVGEKDGKVVIEFGTPVSWIGFKPDQSISLGRLLIKRGRKLL